MRRTKKQYKFEISQNGGELEIERFEATHDSSAIVKLLAKIRGLEPGSSIVLFFWDRRTREWALLRRGGKDL